MPVPRTARKTNSPRQSVKVFSREPAHHRQSSVEADQRAAGEDVASGGLRDDDPHTTGESLHESSGDQKLNGEADGAQGRGRDVRGDADQ
jgi:hypothetical protein